jgi:hypothetical protein
MPHGHPSADLSLRSWGILTGILTALSGVAFTLQMQAEERLSQTLLREAEHIAEEEVRHHASSHITHERLMEVQLDNLNKRLERIEKAVTNK